MILEELLGNVVTVVSRLVIHRPPLSPENLHGRGYSLVFEENPERDDAYDGLIHREYEEAQVSELPYYEEDICDWGQDDKPNRRNLRESFLRSLKANFGLMMAVIFILGFLIVGVVYLNLNTCNACYEWTQKNFEVPSHVKDLQMVGILVFLFPIMLWFPGCIVMVLGLKEFRKNYLCCVCGVVLLTVSITSVYNAFMFDKIVLIENAVWL